MVSLKYISIDVPISPTSIAVCILFFLLIKPIRTLVLRLFDDAYTLVHRKLWEERSWKFRSAMAMVLFFVLYFNRAEFLEHVGQYLELSLSSEVLRNIGLVPQKVDPNKPLRRLLIIGEVGDGKSTMVNALRDKDRSREAASGKAPRGVTKNITSYVGLPIAGYRTEYLDTPGVGDKDITPERLISMLEERLGANNKGYVHGVLVTTPALSNRVTLGLQVVSAIVEKGFLGDVEKWSHVILVGTKSDKADDEEKQAFRTLMRREFFSLAPSQDGKIALVNREDYSELKQEILKLPDFGISYVAPTLADMSATISNLFSIERQDFEKKLEQARQEERAVWNQALKQQKREADEDRANLLNVLSEQNKKDAQKVRDEYQRLQEDLERVKKTAETAQGEAKEYAKQQEQAFLKRLEIQKQEVILAQTKQREADLEVQAQQVRQFKTDIADSKVEIEELRRKLKKLEDEQQQKENARDDSRQQTREDAKEQVKLELQSQEAELRSKEGELEAQEAKFNKSRMEYDHEVELDKTRMEHDQEAEFNKPRMEHEDTKDQKMDQKMEL